MTGKQRKSSSNTDVGGPSEVPVRTPPMRPSPTATTPPVEIGSHVQRQEFMLDFSILDAFFMLYGMVTYVADFVTDLLVATRYVYDKEPTWAGLTFAFVIVPSITLQYFSLRWFVIDSKEEQFHQGKRLLDKALSWTQWIIFHLFQLGAVKRYWRTLKYGWRSRDKSDDYGNRMRNYRTMVYEYRDITMLRLLEAFMESAPQLVLQLYIMKRQDDRNEDIHWITGISALASLSSLSWGLEAYHKALRESRLDKKNIGYIGVFFRMVWRTLAISSRVLSMALFATEYQWIIFPIVGIHWLIMTIWLVWQDTNFCTTQVEELFFDAVIGFVYIFSFFNMKEGRTRYRAAIFYTIVFVENTVMFALWYHYDGMPNMKWYTIPALMLVWGGFAIGLFFQMLYYCFMHPNIEYPCRKKHEKGRTLQPWENRGVDEVDREQLDFHKVSLFTRTGRRNLQAYPELLEDISPEGDGVLPKVNMNHSNDNSYTVCNSLSPSENHSSHGTEHGSMLNGGKTWVESQV